MDYHQNPSRTEPSRLLVATDDSTDPHMLVRLCCERAASDPVSVALLAPADDESGAWSGIGAPDHPLRRAAALLDAAGFRLEDVIVADDDGQEVEQLVHFGGFDALLVSASRGKTPSAALSLAVRSARLHGLTILGSGHQPVSQGSWLRRVLDPLVSWPRPG